MDDQIGTGQTSPPGWYPDPGNAASQRYWDGREWTELVSVSAAPLMRGDSNGDRRGMSAWAIVAFVVAILALLTSPIPILNNITGFVICPIALILGVIALFTTGRGKARGRGFGIASIIISVVSFVVVLASQALYSSALEGIGDAFNNPVSGRGGSTTDSAPFGSTVTYRSGLGVTASNARAFKPSAGAIPTVAPGATAFKVEVTAKNGGETTITLLSTANAYQSGAKCEQIYDSQQLPGDSTGGSLPPGMSSKYTLGFACQGTGDVQLEIRPGLTEGSAWFAGPVT